MKKKVVAFLLAATTLGALFTGCGSDNSSTGTKDAAVTEDTDAAEDTAEDTSAEEDANASDDQDSTQDVTTLRVHVSNGPAPYMVIDDDGNPGGFDFVVFEEAINRLPQYEAEYIVADDGLTGVLSGLYDVTIGNWVYREERAESYYYTFPYKKTDKVFLQRADDEPLVSLEDAAERGYSVIVGASGGDTSAMEQWNEEHPDAQIKIIYSEAATLVRYQNVEDGIADFTLDDGPMMSVILSEYDLPGVQTVTLSEEALSDILPTVNTYYLLSKDEKGLKIRDDLNVAIKEMYEDGTLAKLSEEYFGYDSSPNAEDFETPIN